MKGKILIGLLLMFMVIGTCVAFEINELKTIPDYTGWDANGYSNYTTNSDRYFLVEKIHSFDDDFKDEWFNNHTDWEFTTYPVGDNIWYVEDNTFEFYGYQEVAEIDGDYYMVSVNQNSHLSPSEMNLYLQDLKDFNKLNNLEPIEV